MSSIGCNQTLEYTTQIVRNGKIILYPTDTVWGIGCDAMCEESIQRIFEIKCRPQTKSMILLVADVPQLEQYVKTTPGIIEFLQQQTKPTTVIYPSTKIPLAKSVYAIDGSVAIRVVKHAFCEALIQKISVPLVSTSANISTEPAPHSYRAINTIIKESVDYIVPCEFENTIVAQPSQIVRFTDSGLVEWIRK